MFTLAISSLTTSKLPWFMDLTFQVPIQYCSLQHQTLLLSPAPSTTGCCFCFGSIPLFFLELFLHWSPVAYWASTDLGSSSFSVLSFCLFILFMGFSKQGSSRKTCISALLTMPKPLTVWITINCGKFLKRWEYQTTWPASWEICMQVRKQPLELDMEQQTGSKLGMEYVKAVYCHPTYLTYMQSTSWETLGWRKYKLESRLPGEIS